MFKAEISDVFLSKQKKGKPERKIIKIKVCAPTALVAALKELQQRKKMFFQQKEEKRKNVKKRKTSKATIKLTAFMSEKI